MKAFLTAMSLVVFSSLAFANPAAQSGELNLGSYDKVIASTAFATSLAEANSKVNGKKIRMFYSSDRSSRTTVDTLKVIVAGRIDDASGTKFQKAEFEATSLSGGMYPTRTSEVIVTTITQEDFVNFYN